MRGFSIVCLIYCVVAQNHGHQDQLVNQHPDLIRSSGRIAHLQVAQGEADGVAGQADVPASNILDGAIIPAKSGRVAHNREGEEVGADGLIITHKSSFWGRFFAALHLSSGDVESASPTPPQPEYIKSESLDVETTEASFFGKLMDKLSFGGSSENN